MSHKSSKTIVLVIIAFLKLLEAWWCLWDKILALEPESKLTTVPEADLPLLTVKAALETESANRAPKSLLCQWPLCHPEQATLCSDPVSLKQEQQWRMREHPRAHGTEYCSFWLFSLVPMQMAHSVLLKTPPTLYHSCAQPHFQVWLKQHLFWDMLLPHNHFLVDDLKFL